MNQVLNFLNKSFGVYNIKGIYIEPTYWMAGVIVLLIFMLLFTIARIRWLYVHWNLGRPAYSMLFWGFLLALIFEGFLWISGKTILTEILGWKNAPKPISTALDVGRERLMNVLGESQEIPESVASEPPTFQTVVSDFQNLSDEDAEQVRSFICRP